MKITKTQLKQIIKEELEHVLLKEANLYSKLINLMGKDHSARYKGKGGKKRQDFERVLKKSWNRHADRNFIDSVKLVHWNMSGDPTKFLTTPSKDETSAEGYLPNEPMVSNFAKGSQVGVLIDGYVTFAMNSGGATGFFGGKDAGEKWKSSGMVKRAPEHKANRADYLILNKDSSFRGKGTFNEFIVDNWKPKALVAVGGADNKFYKELYAVTKKTGLPIIDENGKEVECNDPAERPFGKKLATGIKRMAGGALPENKS